MSPASTLVLFDCDGVLVDSERLVVDIDVAAVAAAGWPVTREQVVETFVGRSDADVVALIEAQLGHPLPAGWDAQWDGDYRRVLDEQLEPVPGVRAAVEEVVARGRRTCVASSGSHDKLRFTLGHTGLYERFEGRIFSGYEVANGKPAPDLFLHTAARMGAEPARCAVVEDSRFGVEAARAAGMRAFGYAGGLTPPDRLEGHGAVVFEDMRELPRLLADAAA
jgi:HAD superfamily hydrolase (TIGR01509 family)